MKYLKYLLCAGAAVVAVHAAETSPMAAWPKAYSVEMEVSAAGNKTATKMFVDGDKQRMDMNAGGMEMSTIIRKDKKLTYSLMHAQKMVMENPLQEPPAAPAASGPAPVWEKVGSATVNGVACTEYKVKAGNDVTTWFLGGDKLPVRMVAAGNTTDWKNFKAGAPDAAVFEIPAGYSKPGEAPAGGSTADSGSAGSANSGAAAPAEQPKKKKGLGGMLGR